ncbi:MAG: Asp-tRNA(Asn)/Glu-tRNA(Gln) amidotransferase GatCAB subunit B, partial [Brevibacterium aurantiacum]|nr:Asp-tRNA(Asn)/Glu-tRNA(Gln) amidotransferase GatCAB subunit B [Brevibacterium aurantiacum]
VNAGLLEAIEETVNAGAKPAAARKWWTGEVARLANQKDQPTSELVTPAQVAALIGLINDGKLNDKLAKDVLTAVADGEGEPAEVMSARNLEIVEDTGALEAAVDEAIAANPDVVEKIKGGKMQAIGALMGPIMKATRGQADAGKAKDLILAKING